MILIIMILIVDDRGWIRTYPAAPEPIALVHIAHVRVVVLLDAVQRGCSVDLLPPPRTLGRGWSWRTIEQSRGRSPKTWWPPFTWADEHEDDLVSEACSPYSCARRNRDGEALDAAGVWRLLCIRDLKNKWMLKYVSLLSRASKARRQRERKRRRRDATGGNFRNIPHKFPLWVQNLWNSRHLVIPAHKWLEWQNFSCSTPRASRWPWHGMATPPLNHPM
jgi:hypothetical protein